MMDVLPITFRCLSCGSLNENCTHWRCHNCKAAFAPLPLHGEQEAEPDA